MRRAALAGLALLTACAAPQPAAPTLTPVPAAAVPTRAVPTVLSVTPPPGSAPTVLATPASPGALDGLTAEQRTAFADARLREVEGDFAAAADKFRALSNA